MFYLYLIMIFFLSIATAVIGVFLSFIRIPEGNKIKEYNISRYILSAAYIILSVLNVYKVLRFPDGLNFNLIDTSNLMIASYQSLLFTFILLILIQPGFVSFKWLFVQLGIITSILVLVLILLNTVSPEVYLYIYYIISVIYIVQLAYYTFIFRKRYKQCIKQIEDYYDEDEVVRLKWIRNCFYMALTIGGLVLLNTYLPLRYNKNNVPVIIIFYIYFAIKYFNYLSDFRYVVAAVSSTNIASGTIKSNYRKTDTDKPLSLKEEELKSAIGKWVEDKMFLHDDMSRDDIAASLGTDRSFLSSFFHDCMKIEFRVWRTQLRIEEAKKLLLDNPDVSVSKIGQMVGIPDRSNFQRKFIEQVGSSPKEWRRQHTER